MLRVLLIALVLVSGGAHTLEPPSPTPSEPSNPPQQGAANTASKTNDDKCGTDDSPLSIKLLNTGKSADEAEREAKNEETKASRERWLVIASVTSAIATAVLVCVTALLACFTYKLWHATSQASERQSREMRESLAISKQSADAAKTSADTGHNQFIAAHRPKIIMRRASRVFKDRAFVIEYVIAKHWRHRRNNR